MGKSTHFIGQYREPDTDVMQRRLERKWSFSGLATMVRIALMYYVDFYSLFNNPEKDWENMAVFDEISPHQLTLF